MLVVTDNILVAATIEFRQAGQPFSNDAHVGQYPLLRHAAISQPMKAFRQCLVDRGGFADPPATRKFIDQRYGCRIFDVEGHENLHWSTIGSKSTMLP